jgi:hypothetical protein
MPAVPDRVSLNRFLAGLPDETADELRDVARVMIGNEQIATPLRGIELELRPFFITAGLSFIAGMVLLIYFAEPGGFLDRLDGGWPLLIASLGFLPALLGYYAFRIRRRSQADVENFDLNKVHFLPHGAIYFPSDSGIDEQMVTLVEAVEQPIRRSKWDKLKPGAIW